MQNFTKILCFCLFLFSHLSVFSQFSNLRVSDPRVWNRTAFSPIDSAAFTIKPKGLYAEVGAYITYSSKGTAFINPRDTLEVIHNFSLPKNVLVTDSWLWIEDFIVRAKIIDRWTATTIYNNIVGFRQDPSLLVKNSATDYSLRIFPMAGNQTRRVKLTFNIPLRWQGNQAILDLPVHLLFNNTTTLPKLNVRVFDTNIMQNPRIAELPSLKLVEQTDTLGFTLGAWMESSTLRSNGKLSVIFDSPAKNGVFLSHYSTSENEGYYQMMVFPSQIANLGVPARNLLVALDYNSGNTSIPSATVLSQIRDNLKETLTAKDSFNLIFNKLNPTPLSTNWFPASKLDSVFNALGSSAMSNISNLPSILGRSVEYIKSKGSGRLILYSSDASILNSESSNEIISELKKISNTLPSMHILDFSNRNNNGYWIGSIWYQGNSYLYINLARQTGGSSYDIGTGTNLSDFSRSVFQSANNAFGVLDLYTTLEDGYCHSRYNIDDGNLSLGSPIIQVGKYRGKMPFRIELSGSLGATDFAKKIAIPASELASSDNTVIPFWTGQQISKLENTNVNDNATITQIIDISMRNRVLSRYTAFLALEPSQGGDTCRTCDNDKNRGVSVTPVATVVDAKFKMLASPNPFTTDATINITFSAWKTNSPARIIIYDMSGRVVKTFNLNIKQGDTEVTVNWDAKEMPSGIYMVKFIGDNLEKTIKLVKME